MTTIQASAAAQLGAATAPPPPPPPDLTAVQQGDLAAGRISVVEGQVFGGESPDAPQTRDWGAEPVGSAYRLAFDSAAARLGTRDPATVGAELDRQLGIMPTPAPIPAQANGSQEGFGSAIEGAILGDFGNNDSWSATAGQIGGGLVPIAGQIADARDTAAAIGQVWRGEEGGWLNLGAAAIGWVPGIGDAAKAAIRGGERVADAGGEVAQGAARQADKIANGDVVAQAAQRAGIPEQTAREILALPPSQRPDPSTYMSADQITQHLAPFRETGAVRLTSGATIERYGTIGPPNGTFTMSRADFDRIRTEANGDLTVMEQRLGLNPGSLSSGDTVAVFIRPDDLQSLRVPTGSEAGVNQQWLPGGFTSGGTAEAVINAPAGTPAEILDLGL